MQFTGQATFALEQLALVHQFNQAHVHVDDPQQDQATLEVDVPREHEYCTALLHAQFIGQACVLQD